MLMALKRFLPVLLFLFTMSMQAQAQFREILYATIHTDSVLSLHIDLLDSAQVFTWHNSAIFIETEVTMSGCPESLLRHVAKDGRYALVSKTAGDKMTIVQTKVRPVLNGPKGSCDEWVKHRIYIPADFVVAGRGDWVRSEPHSKTTLNYE